MDGAGVVINRDETRRKGQPCSGLVIVIRALDQAAIRLDNYTIHDDSQTNDLLTR